MVRRSPQTETFNERASITTNAQEFQQVYHFEMKFRNRRYFERTTYA